MPSHPHSHGKRKGFCEISSSAAGILVWYLLVFNHCCVFNLEGRYIFKKNPINVAHLPTLMLAIGYPIYWAEMLSGRASTGVTSAAATVVFLVFALFVIFRERTSIIGAFEEFNAWFRSLTTFDRIACALMAVFIFGIFLITCYASALPIHLQQEGDALNYHYSLTRQHLILASFAHIPWSAFDLFLLPVDFALAPYWFVTQFPNKIPQFIFFVGLVLIMVSLVRHWQKKITFSVVLVLAFFFGSHGHGIQFGTAMLDLVNCYLFLAMLNSFIHRVQWLFMIEACFYLWAKPFVPVQSGMILVFLAVVFFLLKYAGFKDVIFAGNKLDPTWIKESGIFLRKCVLGFILISVCIAGPFIGKSLLYAGTPLFPFAPGLLSHHQIAEGTKAWDSLRGATDYWMTVTRNTYGNGRSIIDFVQHFWCVAVPSQGVNNEFDYPLGLTYLIVLGPFLWILFKSIKERKIFMLGWLVVIFWLTWFQGSQQSRWLFLPLILIFIAVALEFQRPSKILMGCLLFAISINFISIARAHSSDIRKFGQNVIRPSDRELVHDSVRYIKSGQKGFIEWSTPEVAYARFPVVIREESLPNVLAF